MKALFAFVVSVGVFGSVATQAQSLPQPLTCGQEFKGLPITIEHSGGSLFTRGLTYKTTLAFSNAGEFSLRSNWGTDINEHTINAVSMRDKKVYGTLQHFALSMNSEKKCDAKPDRCALDINSTLDFLSDVSRLSLARGNDEWVTREQRAISCARSISLTMIKRAYAVKDFGRNIPVGALSLSEAEMVVGHLRSVKAQDDAETAESVAITTALYSTSSSGSR